MSSVSGPTAAAPLRDTMSLRPQGFYGYAFVFARTAEIMALVAVVGLVGNFIFMMTTSKQSPAASLVITLVFVGCFLPFFLFFHLIGVADWVWEKTDIHRHIMDVLFLEWIQQAVPPLRRDLVHRCAIPGSVRDSYRLARAPAFDNDLPRRAE